MTKIILMGIVAYMIGNISPAYILTKKTAHKDIREHGSGNAGSTNVLRVVGKKAALITFIVDVLKGVLASALGYHVGGRDLALISAFLVVFGHVFPVVLKFKGGKGVATSLGAMSVLHPMFVLISLLLGVATILRTKYVSLGSMVGGCSLTLVLLAARSDMKSIWVALLMGAFICYTHRENIKRLLNGEERRLGEKA